MDQLEGRQEERADDCDHAGTDEIEATAKQLAGILWTNKLDLEKRIDKEVPLSRLLITCLVEHSPG